ncbi:MAG: Rne/Rng family ribonuclease [Actinomycetota bacterium]|nr:Rne/Rng family ribonuclease [Actinomycetota bacterium]
MPDVPAGMPPTERDSSLAPSPLARPTDRPAADTASEPAGFAAQTERGPGPATRAPNGPDASGPAPGAGQVPPSSPGELPAPGAQRRAADDRPAPERPRIGDTRPAPPSGVSAAGAGSGDGGTQGAGQGGAGAARGGAGSGSRSGSRSRRRRGGAGNRAGRAAGTEQDGDRAAGAPGAGTRGSGGPKRTTAGADGLVSAVLAEAGPGRGLANGGAPVPAGSARAAAGGSGEPDAPGASGELDAAGEDGGAARGRGQSRRRSGRERRGRAVGRYLMCVHVQPHATQIAVLEGRTLVEHMVSRAADDATQIDGNIYRGRVQNVLPGMEAAFVDIGTPKNAVLYRGDVRYDPDDVETATKGLPRIEEMLVPGQLIVCQVTKNPIGAKGARLTQEVSIPGRFAVMVPSSSAFGISKRLDDNERRRLRRILDEVRPAGHGLIVRTAAEGASREELATDIARLMERWSSIEAAAAKAKSPALLYREPDIAVRIVREELNRDYRAVVIDDPAMYDQVRSYVEQVNPELVDRVELYDQVAEQVPVFERFHVHEQLHKALDRKVWLPSGGSLIIERTEALTVIDVNTGKNVGTSNLEETVFRNNLEAAEEIARQLRLRDIGGIIVIDFIDMEIRDNREKVATALRAALARDKTRTQVFDISELGLVEMTRKRISEGLVESLSTTCTVCGGRGAVIDESLV